MDYQIDNTNTKRIFTFHRKETNKYFVNVFFNQILFSSGTTRFATVLVKADRAANSDTLD
jgi:hypothetical protein